MKKRIVVSLLIVSMILNPINVFANIVCNDGTISKSCTACTKGCCSKHGGCTVGYNGGGNSGGSGGSNSSSSKSNSNSNSKSNSNNSSSQNSDSSDSNSKSNAEKASTSNDKEMSTGGKIAIGLLFLYLISKPKKRRK